MNIGVDFGTTVTLLSKYNMGEAEPIVKRGEVGYPSDIYVDPDAENGPEIFVGEEASRRGIGNRSVNLLRKIKLSLSEKYHFFRDKNGRVIKKTTSELLEALLSYVKEQSLGDVGDNEIENVVATVPAGFGNAQTTVITDAVKKVFGKVSAIVEEPVSAAISYFERTGEDCSTVLVFDLGGGTCDIALVKKVSDTGVKYKVIDQAMTVEKTTGKTVGAERWDAVATANVLNALYSRYQKDYEASVKWDFRKDAAKTEYVRRQVVKAKHAFSAGTVECPISIAIGPQVYTFTLTKELFDRWTRPLLNEAVSHLRMIYDSNKASAPPEKIICVGGGSRMPQVKEAIEREFAGTNVRVELSDPEFAVVKGAAIYANSITGAPKPVDTDEDMLLDIEAVETESVVQRIAPFSYGVYCKKHGKTTLSNIIIKGTPLAAFGEKGFTTSKGSISTVHLKVYENDSEEESVPYNAVKHGHRKVGMIPLKLANFSILKKKVTVNMVMDNANTLYVQIKDKKKHSASKLIKLSDIK